MSSHGSQRRSSALRDRIESLFERWGRFACTYPTAIIVATLGFTIALASWIPDLEVDNSQEAFLHPNDPVRIGYDRFRQEFGRDERILVTIEAEDIFAPESLLRLRALHEELEERVPHLEDVSSLINARNTRGEGDTLIVEDLLEEWPETPAGFEALRARVLGSSVMRGSLVDARARITVVAMRLVAFGDDGEADALEAGFQDETPTLVEPDYLPEPEISRAVDAARDVISRHDAPGFRLLLAGMPVMAQQLNRQMIRDMSVFTALAVLAIALFLFALYRRLSAVVLPLLVVILSMLATLGVMALSGFSIGMGTQILPSFLLCVGVCDAVHLLAIFYQRAACGEGRKEAIAFCLGHSGLAIVMTSLTTMGGLGSFVVAELKPVADLGIFAPVGVFFALVYTIVLMPALLAVIPTPPPRARGAETDRSTRFLLAMGDVSARYPWSVVSIAAALLVISLAGTHFLRFSHDPVKWLPEDDPFSVSTRFMDANLDGVNSIEIVLSTGEENGLYEPDFLNRLEELHRRNARTFEGTWRIAKTLSVNDVIKETHQALNENRREFYAIPQDRALVAQELVLFENSGSDDLGDFVDPLFSKARVTLRVPWMDAVEFPPKLDDIAAQLHELFPDAERIEVTGLVPVMARTLLAVLDSMSRSYALAVLVILPLMVLLIGHLFRGVLSMIPNLTPVIMMLGFMGWSGIPVDGLTMMVGAIVLGLAVDDTIHFMHNFRRYYERSGDAREAIRETLETTGRALLVTSLVLSAGFFTYLGAYMSTVRIFGLLAGGAILVAFLSNIMLASALMVLATRRSSAR